MKKRIALLLALCLTLTALCGCVDVEGDISVRPTLSSKETTSLREKPISTGSTDDGYKYAEYADHIELISYTGNETAIYVPAKINDKPVTELGRAFNNTTILSIRIPATVTVVRSNAFDNCCFLAHVSFAYGSTVTTIETNAFYCCQKLSIVLLPDSMNRIDDDAFKYCSLVALKADLGTDAEKAAKAYSSKFTNTYFSIKNPSKTTAATTETETTKA